MIPNQPSSHILAGRLPFSSFRRRLLRVLRRVTGHQRRCRRCQSEASPIRNAATRLTLSPPSLEAHDVWSPPLSLMYHTGGRNDKSRAKQCYGYRQNVRVRG